MMKASTFTITDADLLKLQQFLQSLFAGEDNIGCTEDLTVVYKSDVDALREWYDNIQGF